MFDHVTIRVSDRAASEALYTETLETLGIDLSYSTGAFAEWRDFSLTEADDAHPVTRNLHVAFVAPSREQVDQFWEVGRAAGAIDDGAPGPRPQYVEDYYGAFLRDPDGNSFEAVHYERVRRDGVIDHLWLRTDDLAAQIGFYETIAPAAGLRVRDALPGERTTIDGGDPDGGSFTFIPTEPGAQPTRNVHIAFAGDEDAVRRFYADATAAGHAANGEPGERPQYHPGYYAAYILDPDGHNIEVVDHHRLD